MRERVNDERNGEGERERKIINNIRERLERLRGQRKKGREK